MKPIFDLDLKQILPLNATTVPTVLKFMTNGEKMDETEKQVLDMNELTRKLSAQKFELKELEVATDFKKKTVRSRIQSAQEEGRKLYGEGNYEIEIKMGDRSAQDIESEFDSERDFEEMKIMK